MAKQNKNSAGILMYRVKFGEAQFLLVHPGGPFWKNKNEGAWSMPKGEFDVSENPLDAAIREFEEETGQRPEGEFAALGDTRLKSGKRIQAWLLRGDFNVSDFVSNTFTIEWPPRSGKQAEFPEVDKAAWFKAEDAMLMIHPAQMVFITKALDLI